MTMRLFGRSGLSFDIAARRGGTLEIGDASGSLFVASYADARVNVAPTRSIAETATQLVRPAGIQMSGARHRAAPFVGPHYEIAR